ncbi:MAG TPA: hypothetical protein VFR58_02210 [Flavisolibacter sp.]|nr:hypothetical protein [Flavisolibacter sp.]
MQESQPLFSLTIDNTAREHLGSIAKWARFLAVAGLVLVVLSIIGSFISIVMVYRAALPGVGGSADVLNAVVIGTAIGSLIILVITVFPLVFLLHFARKMQSALSSDRQQDLNDAFLQLKRHSRYLAIMIVIMVSIYGISMLSRAVAGGTTL